MLCQSIMKSIRGIRCQIKPLGQLFGIRWVRVILRHSNAALKARHGGLSQDDILALSICASALAWGQPAIGADISQSDDPVDILIL